VTILSHEHPILDKPIVLALNSAWQVIGHRTVRQAIVALTGGDRENPPALGLDIAYPVSRTDGTSTAPST